MADEATDICNEKNSRTCIATKNIPQKKAISKSTPMLPKMKFLVCAKFVKIPLTINANVFIITITISKNQKIFHVSICAVVEKKIFSTCHPEKDIKATKNKPPKTQISETNKKINDKFSTLL